MALTMKQTDGTEELIADTNGSLSEQFNDSIGDTTDLPTSLIITNIDSRVFAESDLRVCLLKSSSEPLIDIHS